MIALHERLSSDCRWIGMMDLCQLLLMRDAHYPWLILVPDSPGLSDFHDLDVQDHLTVMSDISRASRALKSLEGIDKINVAALGNMVPQLHIHVIGRKKTDLAWPGPVWGVQPSVSYDPEAEDDLVCFLKQAIKLVPSP